ncbi:MAG: hypothetical protein WCW27_02285 [Patescibacteria group bacterium]|jgi:hypothetical protein
MTKLTCLTNKKLQHRKQTQPFKIRNYFVTNGVLLVVLLGMSFSYMRLVNSGTASTFHLNSLLKEVAVLQAQQQNLQLDTAEALSLQRLSLVAREQSQLIPTTKVEYLPATNAAVALLQ